MSESSAQRSDRSDARIFGTGDERNACSLWWRGALAFNAQRIGRIGGYDAISAAAGGEVLGRACARLAEHSCTLAVGPMDGSTWHRYRFITERGDEPPFFLEPDNPDEYPEHFRAAGFRALAHYSSALDHGLHLRDANVPAIEERLALAGVTIRTLEPASFEREIRSIHRVCLESFARNFLYTPIGEDEFAAMYMPLRDRIDPSLVFIAEEAGAVAGFVFGLPDWLRVQREGQRDTMIVKTLARRADERYRGLGSALLERCRRAASDGGYTRCVHALMYDENASVGLSNRFGTTMRGYTLFARDLSTT